ncbi:MAG: energy-coupling factor transporter transmembrane protein EcfT [Coriobacteriales bacterium]|nr:energy-coupling factor transporter transmembrane protein EcfT [Coriobacteriales bacterium]
MATGFTFGNYYRADSFIHGLDARIKINLMLLLMTVMFISNSFYNLAIITAFMLSGWLIARIPYSVAWRAMLPAALFALFPFFFDTFFIADGQQLFQWGILRVTDAGLSQGIYMGIRLFLLFGCGILVTLTTTSLALAYAIGSMLEPFRRFGLPAYEISLMIRIALRFIPDIGSSFNHIRKAQQARGAVFDHGSPLRRVKALIPCLVPLFAECFRNAENLALAMESRCYHGSSQRSYYREYRIGSKDILALSLVLLLIAGSIVMRVLM